MHHPCSAERRGTTNKPINWEQGAEEATRNCKDRRTTKEKSDEDSVAMDTQQKQEIDVDIDALVLVASVPLNRWTHEYAQTT